MMDTTQLARMVAELKNICEVNKITIEKLADENKKLNKDLLAIQKDVKNTMFSRYFWLTLKPLFDFSDKFGQRDGFLHAGGHVADNYFFIQRFFLAQN